MLLLELVHHVWLQSVGVVVVPGRRWRQVRRLVQRGRERGADDLVRLADDGRGEGVWALVLQGQLRVRRRRPAPAPSPCLRQRQVLPGLVRVLVPRLLMLRLRRLLPIRSCLSCALAL